MSVCLDFSVVVTSFFISLDLVWRNNNNSCNSHVMKHLRTKTIVIFIQNILQKHIMYQIGPSGCLGGVLNKKSFVWHAKVCSTSEVNQEAILSILLLLLPPWQSFSFSFSLFLSFFGSFFIVVPQPPSQQILFFSPSPVSPEKNGAAVVVKFFLFPVNDWKSSKVLEEVEREKLRKQNSVVVMKSLKIDCFTKMWRTLPIVSTLNHSEVSVIFK